MSIENIISLGDGTESPESMANVHQRIAERTFCFIDIVEFTKFTQENGLVKALELVEYFRAKIKDVATARGVRIAKWLGDGVMLHSINAGPTIATAVHVSEGLKEIGVELRTGIATGPAIFLDGEDYVGEPVNLASKLASVVEIGAILACVDEDKVPSWVEVAEKMAVNISGIGRVSNILRLKLKVIEEVAEK